jgi:hypothetical protein
MNRPCYDSVTFHFVSYYIDAETDIFINKKVFYEADGHIMSKEFKGAERMPIAEILLRQEGKPIPNIEKFIIGGGFKEGFSYGEYVLSESGKYPLEVFSEIIKWFDDNGIKRTWGHFNDYVEFIKHEREA